MIFIFNGSKYMYMWIYTYNLFASIASCAFNLLIFAGPLKMPLLFKTVRNESISVLIYAKSKILSNKLTQQSMNLR